MPGTRPTQDEVLGWLDSLSNWGRWGPEDELGTLNHLTPERTRRAIGLVQEGVTVSCAAPVVFNQAAADVRRPPEHFMVASGESWRPGDGVDRQVAMDYFGLIFHGNTITHLDSLAHFFWDGQMYNGRPSALVTTAEGATRESIDLAKNGIVTRGVLVDAARLRGVDFIERGDGVGVADIERAEAECGFRIEAGDVLLLRTGQLGERARSGPVDVTAAGSAGPLPEIMPLVRERDIDVLVSDTGNDVMPTGYERFTNPVHQIGIPRMGLWILDNAWLDDLAEACAQRGRWEFLINILPLRLTNVTGSPCNPVAVF
ncbi:MAG: cyclase family protein [Dehalococcoidia bacterium]